MSALESALERELDRIAKLRADIIEQTKDQYMPGYDPDLWTRRDGTYILMPLTESRSMILLALALERNTQKKG